MGSFVSNHCLNADCSICDLVAQAMFEIERLTDALSTPTPDAKERE
jgi:hypothetical protein